MARPSEWRPPLLARRRQPDKNPIQGGRWDKIYDSGKVTKPGYSGFRPGEKADPFIDFKVRPLCLQEG